MRAHHAVSPIIDTLKNNMRNLKSAPVDSDIMKLTQEVKDVMSKVRVFPLATASRSGVPNVVPVGFLFAKDDDTVWVIDNYFDKTLANVRENPEASFYAWDPETPDSFQVKCDVEVCGSGAEYEEAVRIAHSKNEAYPAKNLLKLKVRDVFYVTPGPKAGKKV